MIFRRAVCLWAGHDFGDWQYAGPQTCQKVRVCRRCNRQEDLPPSAADHIWGEWTAIGMPEQCQTRECRRCGNAEHVTEHEWQSPAEAATRACRRCGLSSSQCPVCHGDGSLDWHPGYNMVPDVPGEVCPRCSGRGWI